MTPAEQKQAARFPRPIHGRIPNFAGAEEAARALIRTPEFRRARVVKVNPDAPQRSLRAEVLKADKILLAPTPRLRELGRIDAETPIATTVRDLQVVDELPLEPFDVTVDLVVTPTRLLRVEGPRQRPERIIWELLPDEKRDAIPLLQDRAPR